VSSKIPLQRISENVWLIPQTYRSDMRVPVYVFASDRLLEKMLTDRTLIQGVNVATLPGVQKHVAVLPDAHEGYGFPIGGVAAMDATEGVISPGGVGYDINCLPAGTRVFSSEGWWKRIEDVEIGDDVLVVDREGRTSRASRVLLKLFRRDDELLVIRTETGDKIRVTPDHPVLTRRGMVEAAELSVGDMVATHPFEGVQYEEPADFTILSGDEFDEGVAEELRRRGIIPLTSRSRALPTLVKLLGYFTGDGAFDGKKVVFYGSVEDLEEIRRDITLLGYTPSRIRSRKRTTVIDGKLAVGTENSVSVSARSFAELLKVLGAPAGKKTVSDFTVPDWLLRMPLWIKRLYLAALFGAELNKPQTVNGYNFEPPVLSMSKRSEHVDSGLFFLNQVKSMLQEFGVEVSSIQVSREGKFYRLRLQISEHPENLIRLWSVIGYVYNQSRTRLAHSAVAWLKYKLSVISERKSAETAAVALVAGGGTVSEALELLTIDHVNERFIERSVYEGRKSDLKVPRSFLTFEEWTRERLEGDVVWVRIASIDRTPYDGEVYDLTVEDEAHTFVADGFVVSNCGVRLMVTNLTEKDVRPRIAELVNVVFRNVPAGLGSRRRDFVVSRSDLDRVALEGARYVIEKYGLGWHDDYKHIEEEGRYPKYKTGDIPDPDPSVVSNEAKSRGLDQIGTLGSGNHFLEIQKVDKIFDYEAAKRMGIVEEGQVTVLIHCGSRGYGHQICSDNLKIMERAVARYGLRLPDRELACTPASSPEATQYLKAFGCAVNFAFANRQAISHWVRQSFEQVFKRPAETMDLRIVYDVCHNIVKLEKHKVDGELRDVFVHRKGATRSFPGGVEYYSEMIPATYRDIGQPVFVPGSMGTASWVLLGQPGSLEITFGSAVHGAGRQMSRAGAKRQYRGEAVVRALESKGIYVKGDTIDTIVEEVPEAYKNPDDVVEVAHSVGMSKKVARLVPIGVVKG
jgi:tRNA-splicing ligase RtcB